MLRKIEKFAKVLLILSLIGMYLGWLAPGSSRAITIDATVSSTMVTCETPTATVPFGTIDNTAVYATYTTTTMLSSGDIFLKVYGTGSGSGDNPGLWKSPDLIESATAAPGTTTLAAGTEGYGLYATTSSGTDVNTDRRYSPWGAATATAIVGVVATGSGSQFTVASGSSVSSSNTIDIYYKAAVGLGTPGGAYSDTTTYSCTAT